MPKLRALLTAALALTVLLLCVRPAQAQVESWTIDSAHSGIEFHVKHLGVTNVRGSLSGVKGTVKLDTKDMTRSSVDAVIDATTVSTADAKRDEHLKGPEFFNVAKFSTLAFHSTGVGAVNGKLQIMGELTLVGVTKPVTLDLDGPAPPQKGMNGKLVSGFSATGTIKRTDFNFGSKYSAPLIGDDVKFTIDIEMDK